MDKKHENTKKKEDAKLADKILPEEEPTSDDKEIKNLQKQIADLKDQWLRASAETENLRKRHEKELKEAKKFSISGIVKDLVNVVESLYQSTDHITEEDKKNEKVKKIAEGIELTRKELIAILAKHNVKRIEPKLGDPFDHNFHQALSQSPDDKYPKNTIIKVIRAGYLIEDRLTNPALVMVSAGKSS